MALETDVRQAVAAAVEGLGGRVVGIGPGWGSGSGFVVGDGQVVTNAHNVRGDEVPVHFSDGDERNGGLLARDLDGDLALLAVETDAVGPVRWASREATLGTPVVSLANPGGRALRATVGIVSGIDRAFRGPRGRRITGALEHTAPMARGSSGSPLLDTAGNLVAINTHRLGEGFYLAQPGTDSLRDRLAALGRGESPRHLRLGVAVAPERAARHLRAAVGLPERDGVLVQDVDPDGPAASAGLRRGDLIVSASGRALTRADDLLEVLAARQTGGSLSLDVVRGTDELTLDVPVEEAP